MKQIAWFILLIIPVVACKPGARNFLQGVMEKHPDRFSNILVNKDKYEIQIIYTQIDRTPDNKPIFTTFTFNVDSARYFYPASTVKLPLVLLSLEKLNQLNIAGLDKFTPVLHDSVYRGQISVQRDSTAENSVPSIAHYIRKILVVSDNDAFNRLYEFMGQKAANELLREKGYNLRIIHRLERFLSLDENRHTEAIRFVEDGKLVYQQAMLVNDGPIAVDKKILKGKAYLRNDTLIEEPFDFTNKNFFSLTDQHDMLKSVIFPEQAFDKKQFNITVEDRLFVLQYMSQLPRETAFPQYYQDTTYHDAYCKFLLFGGRMKRLPEHIRIFNKVGDAYGYLIDNAYVVDFKNNVEFLLSAVINTNTDEIYNDGKYDYETLGLPFMKDLGKVIYRHELSRKRNRPPDLSAFRFNYDR